MSAIVIKTELLAAIARFAHDDMTRPHIAQVIFRDGEVFATNGHMLVRAKHDTKGHSFGISRAAVFAAVHAQDATARHWNDYAMRLEASDSGDSAVVTDAPHGNRELLIEPLETIVRVDIGGGVVLESELRTDGLETAKMDAVMLDGRKGNPNTMGFNSSYIDAIDVLARASGYFHRGVQCESWDAERAMQWVIPHDPQPDDDHIRVLIMRMRGVSEGKAPRRQR